MKRTGCLMIFLSRSAWSSSQFVRRWRYQFTRIHVNATSSSPRYRTLIDKRDGIATNSVRVGLLPTDCVRTGGTA
jgi:hypothetical protein